MIPARHNWDHRKASFRDHHASGNGNDVKLLFGIVVSLVWEELWTGKRDDGIKGVGKLCRVDGAVGFVRTEHVWEHLADRGTSKPQ